MPKIDKTLHRKRFGEDVSCLFLRLKWIWCSTASWQLFLAQNGSQLQCVLNEHGRLDWQKDMLHPGYRTTKTVVSSKTPPIPSEVTESKLFLQLHLPNLYIQTRCSILKQYVDCVSSIRWDCCQGTQQTHWSIFCHRNNQPNLNLWNPNFFVVGGWLSKVEFHILSMFQVP